MTHEMYERAQWRIEQFNGWCDALELTLAQGEEEFQARWLGVGADFLRLLQSVDEALTSSPDPRDDLLALVESADQSLARAGRLPGHEQDATRWRQWLRAREAKSAEVFRLMAVKAAWDDLEPTLAPLRVRRAALAEIRSVEKTLTLGNLGQRMMRSGMRAFGPRLVKNWADMFLEGDRASKWLWDVLRTGLDELGAWGAATEGVSKDFSNRAVLMLIEIAGHPELAAWAMPRVPLHRLDRVGRRELAELWSDRTETMAVDWIDEQQVIASQAVEVVYLRSLDLMEGTWPGQGHMDG